MHDQGSHSPARSRHTAGRSRSRRSLAAADPPDENTSSATLHLWLINPLSCHRKRQHHSRSHPNDSTTTRAMLSHELANISVGPAQRRPYTNIHLYTHALCCRIVPFLDQGGA